MFKNKDKLKESISRIFLIVFAVMLFASGFLLSIAGDYTPWYIVMGFCLVPVLLLGNQKIRIYASLGLVLTLILIFNDYSGGKTYSKNRMESKLKMKDMYYSKQIDELKAKLDNYGKHNNADTPNGGTP